MREKKFSVIQPNIPQELKWDPSARDFIMDKYTSLTRLASLDAPDLIIWPLLQLQQQLSGTTKETYIRLT